MTAPKKNTAPAPETAEEVAEAVRKKEQSLTRRGLKVEKLGESDTQVRLLLGDGGFVEATADTGALYPLCLRIESPEAAATFAKAAAEEPAMGVLLRRLASGWVEASTGGAVQYVLAMEASKNVAQMALASMPAKTAVDANSAPVARLGVKAAYVTPSRVGLEEWQHVSGTFGVPTILTATELILLGDLLDAISARRDPKSASTFDRRAVSSRIVKARSSFNGQVTDDRIERDLKAAGYLVLREHVFPVVTTGSRSEAESALYGSPMLAPGSMYVHRKVPQSGRSSQVTSTQRSRSSLSCTTEATWHRPPTRSSHRRKHVSPSRSSVPSTGRTWTSSRRRTPSSSA
jgi:hypothetical protein